MDRCSGGVGHQDTGNAQDGVLDHGHQSDDERLCFRFPADDYGHFEKLEKFIGAVARFNYIRRPILTGPNDQKVGVALPVDFYYAMKWGDEAIFSTLMELTKLEVQYMKEIRSKENETESHMACHRLFDRSFTCFVYE